MWRAGWAIEATFQNLARRSHPGGNTGLHPIVSCDPPASCVLKNEHGARGICYQVLHHGTFVDELLRRHAATGCSALSAALAPPRTLPLGYAQRQYDSAAYPCQHSGY